MRNTGIASICIAKILLHFAPLLISSSTSLSYQPNQIINPYVLISISFIQFPTHIQTDNGISKTIQVLFTLRFPSLKKLIFRCVVVQCSSRTSQKHQKKLKQISMNKKQNPPILIQGRKNAIQLTQKYIHTYL